MKNLLILLILLTQLVFSAETMKSKTLNMKIVSDQLSTIAKNINWTTVKEIEKGLPNKKISVGFDVDDTVLFSSSVFYYGEKKYSPGKSDYLKNQKFWDEASTGLDKYSIPKKSALKLITMHLKRKDTIYFITGRKKPNIDKETLTITIKNLFPKEYREQIKPVIFANGTQKGKEIEKTKISIFYGDADSDILSAKRRNIRAIRFLRGAQSTYTPLPLVGKYGEEVLSGSNY